MNDATAAGSGTPEVAQKPPVNAGFGATMSYNADIEPKLDAAAPAREPVITPAAPPPPGLLAETPEARLVRLRALAQKEIDKETDEEVVAQMVAEERAKRAAALLPTDTSGFPAEYVWVTVFKGRDKNDLEYVPLGIDGYIIKVPRGDKVCLPRVFVDECLEHAVEEITVRSQGGLITRPAHRFPYTVHGVATAEEYRQFQVEQKAKAAFQLQAARPMSA